MKMSPEGRALLAEREGRRLRAYKDSVGVWTIGIGHTSAAGEPVVTPDLAITEAECDAIFARDLAAYEAAVNKAIRVHIAQNEFDAMVSLCYNIGQAGFARSTVARRLNAGDRSGAAEAFLMWNKPAVLLSRRRAERAQFLGSAYLARLGSTEKQSPSRPPRPAPAEAAVPWWRPLLGLRSKPSTSRKENSAMLNPAFPIAVLDLIGRAVERAAERPEVDIPAEQKETVAAQVVREARKLPELRTLEESARPKSLWQSRGMIGALVSGAAGVAGAFGFVLAPEEVDAVVGLVANGIAVAGALMAWVGRKNATKPIA